MSPLRLRLLVVLVAALAGACLTRGSRDTPALFTLTDPRGDDHGDGELRYPLRDDLRPGDLDLLSLTAFAEGEGTRFEATFARAIAVPQPGRTLDSIGETQAQRARHGFYTFNLDLYVDMDRVPGSGRTDTLPGRNLALAPGSAWEKVILLSPRPYEARDALRGFWKQAARAEQQRQHGPLGEAATRAVDEAVERELEARVFFPTRIRVTGPTVEFFVPRAFLGGLARPDWGYAAAVTGASLERKLDLHSLLGRDEPREKGLMVLGIAPGLSRERFGGGRLGDPNQSPIVDLLVPEGLTQQAVLQPNGPPWPAVVPAAPGMPPQATEASNPAGLPQAPEAGSPGGQTDAPDAGAP